MQDASNGHGGRGRHQKEMRPSPCAGPGEYPSVVRIDGMTLDDEAQRAARMVCQLKSEGVIEYYGQVALLLNSVQEWASAPYVEAMRAEGVPFQVHGARRFFECREVREMVACFALVLGWTARSRSGDPAVDRYLDGAVDDLLRSAPSETPLIRTLFWWQDELARLAKMGGSLDRGLLDYFYVLLALPPFIGMQGNAGAMSNLAAWSRVLGTFQRFYGYEDIRADAVSVLRRDFFKQFLPLVMGQCMVPGEKACDQTELDCVQVMTVHQSKGLEFPVVITGGFRTGSGSRRAESELVRYAPGWDPAGDAGCAAVDDARRQYVALTRAQDLLVLASHSLPAAGASSTWDNTPDWNGDILDALSGQRFSLVREPDELVTYSVTGDILLYETCPRRYEHLRHYGFEERRSQVAEFGTLVHAGIERVGRLLVDGADLARIDAAVEDFIDKAAERDGMPGRGRLPDGWLERLRQRVEGFLLFVESQGLTLLGSEQELSYDGDGWQVKGRADVVAEIDGAVAILDVKAGARPDADFEVIDRYEQQLALYGLMAQRSTELETVGLGIYWDGESPGPDVLMLVESSGDTLRGGRGRIGATVEKIQRRDFSVSQPPAGQVCGRCDLLTLCKRDGSSARLLASSC